MSNSTLTPLLKTLPHGVVTWLEENGYTKTIRAVSKVGVGQSNPTFIITTEDEDLILRCQPDGELLKSAHAVDREYRVMAALEESQVPVPKMIALADDRDAYGIKFFLMEKVDGITLMDPDLPDLSREERRGLYFRQVDVIASLAQLDIEALGLDDYGRPAGFLDRQIAIWTKQYRAAETDHIPEMEMLITALEGQFEDAHALPHTVVHGDIRLDNMIVQERDGGEIAALIDWELSTLGPVFVDLSYWCAMLRMHHDWEIGGLGGLDRASLGIPEEDELVSYFCQQTGLERPKDWEKWIAFQLFRFAAILQGIEKRHRDGNASAENAEAVGKQTLPVAKLAASIYQAR